MNLQDLRQQIDTVDYQIHDLLNKRAQIALAVGKAKLQEDGENAIFFRPDREKEVLEAISHHNKGPLSNSAVVNIFRAIMKECRELQINTYKKGENS